MTEIQLERNFDRVLKMAAKGELLRLKKLLKECPGVLNRPSEGHHRTLLWEAVNSNRMELVKYLIKSGADVNIPGRYRSETYVLLKPYCIAHKKKNKKLETFLLANGHTMDVYSLAYLGRNTELLKAISRQRKLVDQLQKEDKIWRVTPLHFAAAGNQISTMEMLLESGSGLREHSKLLYEIACRKNNLDMVILLTRFGGIPSEVDVFSVFYHGNEEMIDYFIDRGLNCDKRLGMGWPPIVYLCRGDKGEHPEKIGKLVQHIEDVNAQTPKGVSALHAAARAGYLGVAKILLQHGGEINIRDKRGRSPLYYARKHQRAEMMVWLMKNGATE